MPKTRQRGAIPQLLAQDTWDQCPAMSPPRIVAGDVANSLHCQYVEGHMGPHFCQGEIWGNIKGGRS